MAPVKIQPGEVLRETKDTQVLSGDQARRTSDGKPIPPNGKFWEYIEELSSEQLGQYETEINVYRIVPGQRKKLCEQLHYPEDSAIRFSRRWLRSTWGGGVYNIMVKIEKQIRFNVDEDVDGEPRVPSAAADSEQAARVGATGETAMLVQLFRDSQRELIAELRAARGGDTREAALRDSLNLGTQVLSQAVPAVARIVNDAANPPAATPATNPLMDRFLEAAITKMLNPADPIETFAKMADAMSKFTGGNSGGGESLAQTLIKAAPTVLDRIQAGMAQMAHMKEIELRSMLAAQGARQPALPAVAPHAPAGVPVAPRPVAAQPPPPPPAQTPAEPPLTAENFIEGGIVNILRDPTKPLEDAAHEALIFIDVYASDLVDALINDPNGEEALLEIFRTRPILQNVPQNPRLTEFVKKFLQLARESRHSSAGAGADPEAGQGDPETSKAPLEPQPVA